MASFLKKAIRLGCLLALFGTVICAAPVQAQGGFAMSGSFSAQKLELPQGTSIHTPDIYVVVFNNSDEDINVRMTTNAPLGVTVVLSEYEFPLGVKSQKKIDIGIDIDMEAVPGDYKVDVTAQPYQDKTEGIRIIGGASQEASLTITGESGSVDITTVSASGTPVSATIVLSRTYQQGDFEIARTDTGELITNVSPGEYKASAYVAGRELAVESFFVAANQQKAVDLTVKTIYFEGFEVVPVNQKDTEALVMVHVVSTLKNLLDAFNDVKVNLLVSSETQQESVNILNLSSLERGDAELSYNYVPVEGWQKAVYIFKLELQVAGEIYTTSTAKTLKVDETGMASTISTGGDSDTATPTPEPSAETESSNTPLIIAGAAVGVLLIITVILLARRRAK